MNDVRNGKIYAIIFCFFIIFLGVGGFFLTNMLTNDNNKENSEEKRESEVAKEESKKIEESKDYVYFQNENIKSSNRDISYKEIVINIKSNDAKNIEKTINEEIEDLGKTYRSISDQDLSLEEQEKIIYKDDNIYKASFLRLERYFYHDYVSIVSNKYDFDCFLGEQFRESKAYVIDAKTGKALDEEEILNIFDINKEDIKAQIKERLENMQTKVEKEGEEVDKILITETLKELDKENGWALFIDKGGFLNVSYLVKSSEQDYNDSIVID